MLTQIAGKIKTLQAEVNQASGQIKLLDEQLNDLNNALMTNENNEMVYKQAVEILDLVQQSVRGIVKGGFENLITKALMTVFGDGYEFSLDFDRRGNIQEAEFKLKFPDNDVPINPKHNYAGGEKDVLTMTLRLVVLELFQRKNKSVLLLDEPTRCVSIEYQEACGKFLQEISHQINRQIILVTHSEELAKYGDKNIVLTNADCVV